MVMQEFVDAAHADGEIDDAHLLPNPNPNPYPYPNPNQVIRYANVAKGDARYDLVISNLTEYVPTTNGVKYNGEPSSLAG